MNSPEHFDTADSQRFSAYKLARVSISANLLAERVLTFAANELISAKLFILIRFVSSRIEEVNFCSGQPADRPESLKSCVSGQH